VRAGRVNAVTEKGTKHRRRGGRRGEVFMAKQVASAGGGGGGGVEKVRCRSGAAVGYAAWQA